MSREWTTHWPGPAWGHPSDQHIALPWPLILTNNETLTMTMSMYQALIPGAVRTLNNLSAILGKAAAHCQARQIDEAVFLQSRLFPDMLPLVRQLYIATDMIKGGGARLAGVEIPKYEDVETTFAQLQARLQKTATFLESLQAAQIDGSEGRDIVLQLRDRQLAFKGQDYLTQWVLPNFYFHVTTAYNLLRHGGVELGKRDYLGG